MNKIKENIFNKNYSWLLLVALCFLLCLNANASRQSDSLKIEAFLAIDAANYTNLNERRKFYKKADKLLTKFGYEVKWLGVAAKTVRILQIADNKFWGIFASTNAEIRQFFSEGNKAILGDMLPKIRELWREGELLKSDRAAMWDAQMLSDEQDLIDPFYESMSKKSQDILDNNLKRWVGEHVFGNPEFEGYVTNQEDRWTFGMRKMGYEVNNNVMPKPNLSWKTCGIYIQSKNKKTIVLTINDDNVFLCPARLRNFNIVKQKFSIHKKG